MSDTLLLVHSETASLPVAPAAATTRQRRYQVWEAQRQAGTEPCFGTAHRYVCQGECPWRAECLGLSLRAEWMR